MREDVADWTAVDMQYSSTEDMIADRLTKGLGPAKHSQLVVLYGLC